MARLTREESRALTRTRLIDSARHVYVQRGIGAATVDHIAEQAGYSKGAFYSNFASKEDILLEILRQHMADELRLLAALVPRATTVPTLLEELRQLYAGLAGHPDICVLSTEIQLYAYRQQSLQASVNSMFDGHRAALGALLSHMAAGAGARLAQPAEAVVTSLMGMVHGVLLQQLMFPAGGQAAAAELLVAYLRTVLLAD